MKNINKKVSFLKNIINELIYHKYHFKLITFFIKKIVKKNKIKNV